MVSEITRAKKSKMVFEFIRETNQNNWFSLENNMQLAVQTQEFHI